MWRDSKIKRTVSKSNSSAPRIYLKVVMFLFLSISKVSVLSGKRLLEKGAVRSNNLRLASNEVGERKVIP